MKTTRMVIYPKDISTIFGYSERHAERVYKKLKIDLHKKENQKITLKEFCGHEDFDIVEVKETLGIL